VFALSLISRADRTACRFRAGGSCQRVIFHLLASIVWVTTAFSGAHSETHEVSAGRATGEVARVSVGLALPLSGESARDGVEGSHADYRIF
jgi:hypothetical protein